MTTIMLAGASAHDLEQLTAAIAEDGSCRLIAQARNREEASALTERLRPDVVALDWQMRGALEVIEQLVAARKTRILVLASGPAPEAIAAGAIDVLQRHLSPAPWGQQVLRALKLVARIRMITPPRRRLLLPRHVRRDYDLVAIGASTGGPGAVATVLGALPADFPLPILLVLHLTEAPGQAFSAWLDQQVALPVRPACDGEPLPRPGTPGVLVAPAGRHLEVARGRLHLTDGPARQACRPSIDVLFESLSRDPGLQAVGCLLTGMGRDGAEGLLALRRAGGLTIAQDEATSVVYGMPREAARLEAAQMILPLPQIAAILMRQATSPWRTRP